MSAQPVIERDEKKQIFWSYFLKHENEMKRCYYSLRKKYRPATESEVLGNFHDIVLKFYEGDLFQKYDPSKGLLGQYLYNHIDFLMKKARYVENKNEQRYSTIGSLTDDAEQFFGAIGISEEVLYYDDTADNIYDMINDPRAKGLFRFLLKDGVASDYAEHLGVTPMTVSNIKKKIKAAYTQIIREDESMILGMKEGQHPPRRNTHTKGAHE